MLITGYYSVLYCAICNHVVFIIFTWNTYKAASILLTLLLLERNALFSTAEYGWVDAGRGRDMGGRYVILKGTYLELTAGA